MRTRILLSLCVLLVSVLAPARPVSADGPVPTALTLASSANPAGDDQTVRLTATVTGSGTSAVPTGTVTFRAFDRGPLGTVTLENGRASLRVRLSTGVHYLFASYDGSDSFFPSGDAVTQRWGPPVASRIDLVDFANPAPADFPLTLLASVGPAAGTGVPTGTVTFLDGSTVLGSAELGNPEFGEGGLIPTATLTVPGLGAGEHALTATYAGDGNFRPGASEPFAQVIGQPLVTTTTLEAGTPSVAGFTAFLRPRVEVRGLVAQPTGTVTLLEGDTVLASVPVTSNGSLFVGVRGLEPGVHRIVASYSGDGSILAPSVSEAVEQVVIEAGGFLTASVGFGAAPANPAPGQPVTLTATVTERDPGPIPEQPTGVVTFFDGSVELGTVPLDAAGTASLTASPPPGGTQFVAAYRGDDRFAAQIASTFVFIPQLATTIQLTSSANPSQADRPVTFTARVAPATIGGPAATGVAMFTDGFLTIGRAELDASGTAVLTLRLPADRHTIGASYSGDSRYAGSTSADLTQVVRPED